mmetsp:Transcript_10166/g.15893  ORF Transcript_10166/g.15893 Transcript_10166/m.15893 type:complete len:272 (-) Transcript_10166:3557-4372(-)
MKFTTKSSSEEIYFHVIDVTIASLRKILKDKNKFSLNYDIPFELERRWKERMKSIDYFFNSSWNKFQQINKKTSQDSDRKYMISGVKGGINFQVVCALSNKLFLKFQTRKISSFKSWLLNCLISGFSYDGFCPLKCYTLRGNFIPIKFDSTVQEEQVFKNPPTNDIFGKYERLSLKKNGNINLLEHENKLNKNLSTMNFGRKVEDTSLSEQDQENDNFYEEKESTCNNYILSIAERVYRRNNKWRVLLKDGILNIKGKDLLFSSCKCEFSW